MNKTEHPTTTGATTLYTTVPSPVGELLVAGVRSGSAPGGIALSVLKMQRWKGDVSPDPGWVHAPDEFAHAARQLTEYFAGERTEFDLEFDPAGTPFQQRVWEELRKIPYGTTTTYGAVTAALGLDRVKARAVGGAVGANPLGIVVPCHRVLGANGSLTGYAGGLENKEALLVLEGVLLAGA